MTEKAWQKGKCALVSNAQNQGELCQSSWEGVSLHSFWECLIDRIIYSSDNLVK